MKWNYQKIVCRAALHRLRLLVSDSGATPCPARLPQGQRDQCQPTRPFAGILSRISALKKALSKKENINFNKATQTWVWKPVLPLIIYAIFSGLLNFSDPKCKEKMPVAIVKSCGDEIAHGSYLTMVRSLPSQSWKSTIQLFTWCQSTGLTGFLKKVAELTWTGLCQLRQGMSLELSKTGAIPVSCR